MLSKKQLREQGIRALKKLANHPALKAKKEQQILTLLFASQQWKTSDTIAVTKALAFEFDTGKVIQRALLQGKKVVHDFLETSVRIAEPDIKQEAAFSGNIITVTI